MRREYEVDVEVFVGLKWPGIFTCAVMLDEDEWWFDQQSLKLQDKDRNYVEVDLDNFSEEAMEGIYKQVKEQWTPEPRPMSSFAQMLFDTAAAQAEMLRKYG